MVKDEDDQPRKRLKISRACDCCRRKKVRCNAEYSSSLMKVVKICTNCIKNNDECTFSRVPLKRGPSKDAAASTTTGGSTTSTISDPAKPLHSTHIHHLSHNITTIPAGSGSLQTVLSSNLSSSNLPTANRPSSNSISSVNSRSNSLTTMTLPYPYKSPPLPSATNNTSSVPPIILPPIVYPKVLPHSQFQRKLSDSSPSSPLSNLDQKSTKSPPISTPFWKVPYEMPNNNGNGNSNSSNNSIILDNVSDRRRSSSIDSMLSQSTNGSRFPSLIPSISVNSDAISDSDDDFYSLASKRSRSNSYTNLKQPSQSPRNSISSLSSLNGRMTKNLYIGNNIIPSISYKSNLEYNLSIYYQTFHPNFPILPLDKKKILENVDENVNNYKLGELFNQTLCHLINFKNNSLQDHVAIIQKITSLYPLNNSNIHINDSLLILFFSSLILINYSILLNGDTYNLNLAITASIFNQFKILENFLDFLNQGQSIPPLDFDNIKIYLPKLYYCLIIIDTLSSLSYGLQTTLPTNSPLITRLVDNKSLLYPQNSLDLNFNIFQYNANFNDLINLRNQQLIEPVRKAPTIFDLSKFSATTSTYQFDFNRYFYQLIQEKLDLFNYVYEINIMMKNSNSNHDLEDTYETIMDNNIKLIRLLKKTTTLIINFANFISNSNPGHIHSPQNHHHPNNNNINNNNNNFQPINPYLNLAISQLFKLIKLMKLIIDNLITLLNQVENSHNQELLNRCIKINQDLSISYNLLNLNLNNLQLGTITLNLVKSKIINYQLTFDIPKSNPTKDLKSGLNTWNFEFLNTVVPFIERENTDGWY